MSRKKVDSLIANAVIGAAVEGKTTSEIMGLTGLTEKKIQQIARGAGLKIRRSTSRIPDETRAKIAEMYKEGHTRREIATALGISTRSVSTYIPKDKPEPEATVGNGGHSEPSVTLDRSSPLDEGAPTLAEAIRMHAEAITKLAEAIELNASSGKEAVIKVKVDGGELTLPQDASLIVTKVERARSDW